MAHEACTRGGSLNLIRDHEPPFYSQEPSIAPHFSSPACQAGASSNLPGLFVLDDLPPVYYQLKIGSCTANALAAALRFAHRRLTGSRYQDFEPSRLWIYYQARIIPNLSGLSDANEVPEDANDLSRLIRKDTGSSPRSAIRALLEHGVCMEELWPYGSPSSISWSGMFLVEDDDASNPCAPADMEKAVFQAKHFRLGHMQLESRGVSGQEGVVNLPITFSRIIDSQPSKVDHDKSSTTTTSATYMSESDWNMFYYQPKVPVLERCLQDGFPFIFTTQLMLGARLSNKREIDEDAVWIKPPTEYMAKRGKHTMLAVGFDSIRRLFLVQNSWGPEWSHRYTGKDERLRGRFWMPYEWFETSFEGQPLTYDFWAVKWE